MLIIGNYKLLSRNEACFIQALEHKIVKTVLYIDNQFWLHVITVKNVYSCNSLLYYHLKLMHVVSSQYRHIRHRPPPQYQILKNIFLIIILFKLPAKVLEKSTVICERQEGLMGCGGCVGTFWKVYFYWL